MLTVYLGNIYYNRKTCWIEDGVFPALSHDSRGPLNKLTFVN